MRATIAGLVLTLDLAIGHGARAAPTTEIPVRVGVRAGVAFPVGATFAGSGSLTDTVTAETAVRVDASLGLSRYVHAGGYAHFGGIVPNACSGAMRCSGTNTRVGLSVAAYPLEGKVIDPWFSLGFGYEWLSMKRELGSTRVDLLARGIELLNLDLGVDVRLSSRLRVGPVGSISAGRYTRVTLNDKAATEFGVVLHGWRTLALRVAYDF